MKKIILSVLIIFTGLLILTSCDRGGVTKNRTGSPFGIFGAFGLEHGSFIKNLNFSAENYWQWVGKNFRDLGAQISRQNTFLIWSRNEPELGGGYDWSCSSKSQPEASLNSNNQPGRCGDGVCDPIEKATGNCEADCKNHAIINNDNSSTKNNDPTCRGDAVLKAAFQYGGENFNMILTVIPDRKITNDNEKHFKDFVAAAVKRYSGNGDAQNLDKSVKIKYYQADNEPWIKDQWLKNGNSLEDYIKFLRLLSGAVKSTDPQAKIILGATESEDYVTQDLPEGFQTLIKTLKGEKIFDIVDLHYWGSKDDWQMIAASKMRKLLDDNGYKSVEIWSNENGTNALPIGNDKNGQNEFDQASSLFKRYNYNLAHEVDKIAWTSFVDWSCFGGLCGGPFDTMGLISDGENNGETKTTLGIPRLSFYTYKLLIEKLKNVDWNNIEVIQESDGIYVYKYHQANKNIWVAWNENKEKKYLDITGVQAAQVKIIEAIPQFNQGQEVKDYASAFRGTTKATQNNKVNIYLTNYPVFIEE